MLALSIAAITGLRREWLRLLHAAAAALLLLATGPPVLKTWEALALAAGLLAIIFGECRRRWWRIPGAAALVLAMVGLKGALPRADIGCPRARCVSPGGRTRS